MAIKADKWIRRMSEEHGMIEPFEAGQIRVDSDNQKIVSYGTSSYGYDVRCADEFKIFTNINNSIVDPKSFDPNSFVDLKSDTCIIPPNSFALARTVEYFRIPRSVLTVCLGKSTYARCFSADTKVALADGRSLSLEQMATGASEGERFYGYGVGQFGKVIVQELEAPRLVGQDSLVEVELDNGEVIRATPDHEFLMRDGTMCPAAELMAESSLMPLYRTLRRGYEMTFQPLTGYMYPTHRMADEWNLRHGAYDDVPDTHRHHIDHCRTNNSPFNIMRMDASEHISMHNAISFGEGFDRQEHGLSIRQSLSELRKNDKWYANYRKQQSMRAQKFWHADEYATTRAALNEKQLARWTADEREHQSARLASFWDGNEQARQERSEFFRNVWAKAPESRRLAQAEHARNLKIRHDIDAVAVRSALDKTGSIRGAARELGVDRSVFRRFPQVLSAFRGEPVANHKVVSVRTVSGSHDVYCLTAPETGNFALEAGVFVSNCGIIVNVTPLEPEWEGHVTLEFSNTTPLPAKIYANEGIAQMLFFESDEICDTSYADRGGKYQGQKGVTLPRT